MDFESFPYVLKNRIRFFKSRYSFVSFRAETQRLAEFDAKNVSKKRGIFSRSHIKMYKLKTK